MSAYMQLRVLELDDRSAAVLNESQVLEKEALDIIDCLQKQRVRAPLILLDIDGKATSSIGLANRLRQQEMSGYPQLSFIIGSSYGVDKTIKALADERMSFGTLTLPHNLARIVLLEQLYRACKINRGEPYHK